MHDRGGCGMRVVLGLDPGSRCTGYGVVREQSGVLSLVDTGTIRPPLDHDLAERLGMIHMRLLELIAEHRPSEAAIEDVFASRNADSALKLGQARGAVLVACAVRGLAVNAYAPTTVKKTLVGAGRAEKGQVAFMVGQILGLRPVWAADSSDALAVAICHCNQQRFDRLVQAR